MATASAEPGDERRSVVCCRMGLGHVFSGGCSEINDGVTDTAQMSGPNCEQHAAAWGKACIPAFSLSGMQLTLQTPAPATCMARHRHAERALLCWCRQLLPQGVPEAQLVPQPPQQPAGHRPRQ